MQTFITSKARENILSRIRKGLSGSPIPIPYPEVEKEAKIIYTSSEYGTEEVFVEEFIKLGGKFVFCDSENDFIQNVNLLHESRGWTRMLCSDEKLISKFQSQHLDIVQSAAPYMENAEACITGCEMLVARTGSIMFSSAQPQGRTAPIFYPIHIVFAYADQVVGDIDEALSTLKRKYNNDMPSMVNLSTGPSRTADIEKTLVVGVHGPAEVFCFYINAFRKHY